MTRVAIVVQRCDASVVGGSEALAWQFASLLSTRFEVEILTSTATDYRTWEQTLPAGATMREGIVMRRFPVTLGRSAYWEQIYHRIIGSLGSGIPTTGLRAALQDEFIRFQGPYCEALEDWLREHGDEYAAVVFCTYLYPTTYFGSRAVPPGKTVLVPTLHDEPPAYLPVFAQRYADCARRIWLTAAEQRTARRIWGYDGGDVIGMAVELDDAPPERRERPYLLYCGRIDASKGCDELLAAYARVSLAHDVSLVLTGVDNLGLPDLDGIEFLGFVDERRKRALMAGAVAFVLPSRYESFSIVTLEAMAMRTPVVVNAQCEVLRDHVDASGGGFHYDGVDGLVEALARACTLDPRERERIGAAGQRYVVSNYTRAVIEARLVALVEDVAASTQGAASP